jgi:hypothetical protein
MTIEQQRQELLAELEAYETVREQRRRQGDWEAYQECCGHLQNIGRRLELLKLQEKGAL